MATSGKKKTKGTTVALDVFLQSNGGKAQAPVSTSSSSWASQMENVDIDDGEEKRMPFDRSVLPKAPKASRGPDIDLDRLPDKPPYTAFVGNLPYDVSEEKIQQFFEGRKLQVEGVRLPNENGRLRGFGYVEFSTREDLQNALTFNEEMFSGRKLRVDLSESSGGGGGGDRDRDGRSDRNDWRGTGGDPSRTEGDWRRRDAPPSFNDDKGYNDRSSYNDRGGDRYGDRDGDRNRDRGFDDRRGGGFDDRGDRNRRGFSDGGGRDSGFSDRTGGRYGDRDRNDGYGNFSNRNDRYGGDRYGDDRRGGGFSDRRGGGYDDRRGGGYDDRRGGGYDDRRGGGFDDRRGGGYDDRRGGGYDDRRGGGYDDRRGGGGYDDRRGGGYDDRRGGGFDNRRGGGFDDRRGGGFDDRRGGGRYDDRRGGNDDYNSRNDDHDQDAPRERPRLNLKPRTKPVEPASSEQTRQSSIFGSAKPVDTAAKERAIEEKMKQLDTNAHYTSEDRDSREGTRPRRDSDMSDSSRGGGGSERRLSSSSTKSNKSSKEEKKMVPAPPPKENAWAKPRSGAVSKTPDGPARQHSSGSSESYDHHQDTDLRDNRRLPDDGHRSDYGRGYSAGRQEGRRYDRHDDSSQSHRRRERPLPKSVNDMPKYDEGPATNWANKNKFAAFMDEDNGSDDN